MNGFKVAVLDWCKTMQNLAESLAKRTEQWMVCEAQVAKMERNNRGFCGFLQGDLNSGPTRGKVDFLT
jgi:hypothetical protein